MEKANGESVLSKAEKKENRMSYSVETPYGFHLDLDFLKYVHDIEKGNTIKRIHIQRRAKQSKFSTLPRNFSVPDNGSQSYSAASSRTWSPSSYRADAKDSLGSAGSDSALRLRYIHELNYRRKDNICDAPLRELTPEDFSSCRDRPQFARTSSLPASLPLSTTSSDQNQHLTTPQSIGESRLEFFRVPASSQHVHSDGQIAAAFKRIKELEEQIKTIPELQQTISALEGENRELNVQIGSLSQLLDNRKEQEAAHVKILESKAKADDVNIGNGDHDAHEQISVADLSNTQSEAVEQQVIDLTEQLDDRIREVNNLRVLVENQHNELKAKDVYIVDLTSTLEKHEERKIAAADTHSRDVAINTEELQDEGKMQSCDKNTYVNLSVETRSIGCGVLPGDLEQPPDETTMPESDQVGRASVAHSDVLTDNSSAMKIEKVVATIDKEEGTRVDKTLETQIHQPQVCDDKKCNYDKDPVSVKYCPTEHPPPTDAPVGQYVKRIQDLLQEQWTYLEHGYPDLASAIKQPASKLSSIQNQLMNSLSSLSSMYSTQTASNRETVKTESQQGDTSPRSSLKSIMKKKNSGCRSSLASEARAKKNLQFVGVNGGYETTSSEDSSSSEEFGEANGENTAVATTSQDCDGGHTDTTSKSGDTEAESEETSGPAVSEAQQHRCSMGDAIRSECQILSHHLAELRTTTDNKLRQTLYTVCQEWFRVSSQKSSSPDLVSVYLEEFRSISPSLLQMVVNISDENGNTALHYSVSHSNFGIVKLLLDTGVCDVDHQNKAGYTPVMLTPLASAETDEDMEVVRALLSLGNVNLSATQGGQTALMIGVSHARSDMVKVLLDCGADVNLTDEDGESALMIACQIGNPEIVKLLVSHPDCDLELKDKAGNSALSIVASSAHSEIAELLQAHTELRPSCPSAAAERGGSL
ncbi:KN motif and ankyrin repeat domain-containing protein 4 [Pseudophryne corroboree]|uniref:KN motif and ankyrin repeat domain-containing protein 4 n=1 Tax=Pseudophryne corroboree TaxID=495146 RepID=UPI0030814CD9